MSVIVIGSVAGDNTRIADQRRGKTREKFVPPDRLVRVSCQANAYYQTRISPTFRVDRVHETSRSLRCARCMRAAHTHRRKFRALVRVCVRLTARVTLKRVYISVRVCEKMRGDWCDTAGDAVPAASHARFFYSAVRQAGPVIVSCPGPPCNNWPGNS